MLKQIQKINLKVMIERVTKMYLNSGRDFTVLKKLFSLSGRIDGFLIDNGELRSYQILSKV